MGIKLRLNCHVRKARETSNSLKKVSDGTVDVDKEADWLKGTAWLEFFPPEQVMCVRFQSVVFFFFFFF